MKDSLSAILIEFRRYLFRRAAVSTLFSVGALLIAGALGAAALDNLFGWNDFLRWMLWALLLSLPLGGIWRVGRSLRTLFRRSDRSIALELEGRLHIPGNALVNGVEFRRRTDLPESIRRVYAGYASAAAEKREKFRIFRVPDLRRPGGMLLGAILLFAGYAALWPRPAANAFRRIAMPWRELAPINRTEFRVEPGDVEIPYGGRVLVRASALIDGRPRAGLRLRIESGESVSTLDMTGHDRGATRELSGIIRDAVYRIECGRDTSRSYRIRVRPAPRFEAIELAATPPAYLGLKTKSSTEPRGEFTLWKGSGIRFSARPPAGYRMEVVPGESFVLNSDTTLAVTLIDAVDGIRYPDSARYLLKCRTDRPPSVRFLNRERNFEAPAGSTVMLEIAAEDDAALRRIVLSARRERQSAEIRSYDYPGTPPRKTIREAVPFRLSPRDFPPGSTVEVHCTAFDFQPDSPPGTALPLTIHVTDPLDELRRAASSQSDGRLYKILFSMLDKQEAARSFVTARLRNFRYNDARTLHNRQREIARLSKSTRPLVKAMRNAGAIPAKAADAIDALGPDVFTPLEKKTAPPFNRSGDTLTRHLNEVVLHQSAAIDRLRRLLTGLAAVRRNWEKREQKKIEAAEEKKFYEKLQDLQEKLAEFRTEQKKIIAQTEAFDPAKTDDWSEGEEKLLGDLAAKEAEFSQYFRAAFNDLSKLQSQDFSNSAMADEFVEMYEELQKAGDALVKKKIEIATLAENTACDSAEAVANNLERWLSDAKDYIKWISEENGEMADVDLTDLPAELTDIIGDLIETEEEMTEDTSDGTNSFTFDTDDGLGWGVSDGTIDSMQAKGITGNVLPNNNEVGGRSGEGRSGKSSGQFVEKTATGKGGRKTPTRLVQSPFEAGTVEDRSNDAQGGATGGGKQSGVGSEGLSGTTPDQDPAIAARLAGEQAELKQRTLALLRQVSARGLPSGELYTALRKIDELARVDSSSESGGADIRRIRGEIAAALRRARTAIDAVARADAETIRTTRLRKFSTGTAAAEKIPPGYDDWVGSYFKALGAEDSAEPNSQLNDKE